jgi:hypothetical protein
VAGTRTAQATVRRHDVASGSGSVLLDDGVELPYGAQAFRSGGLRLLRVGQRVRIELQDSGEPGSATIVLVTLATF